MVQEMNWVFMAPFHSRKSSLGQVQLAEQTFFFAALVFSLLIRDALIHPFFLYTHRRVLGPLR